MRFVYAVFISLFLASIFVTAQTRTFRPDDMFQLRRVGATAWAPDGSYAAIEFTKSSRWLDSVPAYDLSLLDVKTRTLRPLSPKSTAYVGFFNAVWSPDSQRVAFLSIDRNAVVRAWVWTVGTATPSVVPNVEPRIGLGDPPIAWVDGDRLAVMSWEPGAVRSGLYHVRILRGRNVATAWQQAFDGKSASVSVLESPSQQETDSPSVELLTVDLRTGARKRLARGRIHSLSVAADGCCITFSRNKREPVAAYFEKAERAGDADAGYSAVNWGTERHTIDARSGAEREKPPAINKPSDPKPNLPAPPQPDARVLSTAPKSDAALYIANGPTGSQLWLSGGAGRPLTSYSPIWHANEWMKDVKLGRAERLSYKATDGTALNAWLLLPPNHVTGTRVPVVTIVYPTSVYGSNEPLSFSPYRVNFEHPQLFAALGYAVLVPSMPEIKNPSDSHALEPLLNGVIPALDAAIAHGAADPDRIAVLGQSDGGFAVLGLITQTKRFRSAIASAGFSNFASLYGTFYGQYRYGDSGRPEAAQILRMLQMEKGSMGMGGPPWQHPDRYRENSSIHRANKVETPLLLIHGELDFIPIQQAEEFFTALYRQDKRVTLLRYAGEGHTISDRANVLDMWQRIERWLSETMR
ncbi:MAG TPA: prolyl oligopeptidase family serine peptidase [Pyrinomonadaceae bacterium]|nr:prolyl oligopeptidase family serine peptidase [Pyrinomonadaceae bacterium]